MSSKTNRGRLSDSYLKSIKPLTGRVTRYWDTGTPGFLLQISKTGIRTFYFRYAIPGGSKKTIKLGRHGAISTAEARTLAKGYAADVAQGIDVQAQKKLRDRQAKNQRLVTLGAFISDYYEDWVVENRKTGYETVAMLNRHFKHLYKLPMDGITQNHVVSWVAAAKKGGLSQQSVQRIYTALRSVLNHAKQKARVIQSHQLEGFSVALDKHSKEGRALAAMGENGRRNRYLNKSEADRLIASLNERDIRLCRKRSSANKWRSERGRSLLPELAGYGDHMTPIVMLALYTGLRRSDLFTLEWRHISLSRGMVTKVIEKSGDLWSIPLSEKALAVLTQWQRQQKKTDGLVFPNPQTSESFVTIKSAWMSLVKRAEISDFTFHDLRHTFASWLVMAGVDLNTVRELLTQKDISTTLRYAHLAPDHKANAVNTVFGNDAHYG